jgi:hypothetical protein
MAHTAWEKIARQLEVEGVPQAEQDSLAERLSGLESTSIGRTSLTPGSLSE